MSTDYLNKLRVISTAILSVVAVLGIVVALSLALLSSLGVIKVLTATSDSMSPTVHNGSLVFVKNEPENGVKNGEVALLQTSQNSFALGRVISKEEDGNNYSYTLKGDNRNLPDEWAYRVGNDNSYSLVVAIPLAGYVFTSLSSPIGAVLFVSLIFVLAVLYVFVLHRRKIKERKQDDTVFKESVETFDDIPSLDDVDYASLSKKEKRKYKAWEREIVYRNRVSDKGADVMAELFDRLDQPTQVVLKKSRAEKKLQKIEEENKV